MFNEVVGNEVIFNTFQAFFTKKFQGFGLVENNRMRDRINYLYSRLQRLGQNETIRTTTQEQVTVRVKTNFGYREKQISVPHTQEAIQPITLSEEEVATLLIYSWYINNGYEHNITVQAINQLGRPLQLIKRLIDVAQLR